MRGCRRARRRLHRALDGELAVDESLALDRHLERCPACRRFQATERVLEEGLQSLAAPVLGPAEIERAAADVRARVPLPPGRPWARPRGFDAWLGGRRTRLALGSAAVLAAVLAVVVPRVLRPRPVATEPRTAAAEPAEHSSERTLEEARLAVRELLRGGDGDEDAAVARFDAATAVLVREGWPLVRLVEDCVGDADPRVARNAARVLGDHGDRLSTLALRAALERPAVAPAAVRALGQLGPDGVPGLSAALGRPALRALALRALVRVGDESAARAIEETAAGASGTEREACLDALARLGAPALESLLRLAAEPGRAEVLARLGRLAGGARALEAVLARGAPHPVELLLEAAARLPSDGARAWLVERALERRHRAGALAALVRWDGPEPLAVLLELRGRIGDDELVAAAGGLFERDPERAAELARDLAARRAGSDALALLELLFDCAVPGTGGVFLELARARELLDPDDRQWAALAVGELGRPADVAPLAEGLADLSAEERRLRAAFVISLWRLAGDEAVEQVLAARRPADWRRLSEALVEVDERGAAVGLFAVARALDDFALARSRETPGST